MICMKFPDHPVPYGPLLNRAFNPPQSLVQCDQLEVRVFKLRSDSSFHLEGVLSDIYKILEVPKNEGYNRNKKGL